MPALSKKDKAIISMKVLEAHLNKNLTYEQGSFNGLDRTFICKTDEGERINVY